MTLPVHRPSTERAAALVLVLLFVVLLTGTVIAYFSRTVADRQLSDASFSTAKADEFARSALGIVTGDLRQEIVAGSDASAPNGKAVYTPKNGANAVPARNGADAIPNLVRVSSAVALPTPGVAHLASVDLSTNPAANGRAVPLRAWNSHYLIPRAASAAVGDTMPVGDFTAPSWVYVTNQGPQVLAAPAAATLGRYAYAIYDEGGLLDANVAGMPTGVTPAQAGRKGSVALADLTALGSSALTQARIDSLVGWRNYATARPGGTLGAFTFDAAAALRFFQFATAPGNNFVSVNNTTWNNRTDQAFPTRQQLIKFFRDLGPADALDYLQYLGTASREKNAPSWRPAYDANERPGGSSSYAYRTNADNLGQINRNVANVRFANACEIKSYALDGTLATRQVKAGDPLMGQRFSLSRLTWLTQQGVNPAVANAADAVKKHFGLLWDSVNVRWAYTSPDGSLGSPPATIKTLAQVAAANREPDFVELLRAGMLDGSLGKTAGDPTDPTKDTAFRTADVDSLNDLQVIRIAANIIDQYDADSWPTAIAFGGQVASGIENVPYINRFFDTPYRPNDGSASSKFCCWYEFEMWNPHQNATAVAAVGPTHFRITGTGAPGGAVASVVLTTGETLKSPVNAFSAGSTYLLFDLQPFGEPTLLDATNSSCDKPPKNIASTDNSTLTGLFVGTIDITGRPDSEFGSGSSGGSLPQSFPSFELQYQNAGGTWVTYQKLANLSTSTRSGANNSFKTVGPNRGFYFHADPRNTRFGGGAVGARPPGQTMRGLDANPYANTAGQAEGRYTANGPIATNPGWKLVRTTAPTHARLAALLNNDGVATTSYNDPDGVLRLGDGGLRDQVAPALAATPSDTTVNTFAPGNTTARPIVLNRPFYSVADLGYAFRDEPWKTLDFFSANSADSGLLDLFSVDDNRVVAGKVSLNTRQAPVLTAMLKGAIRKESDATPINAADAGTIARDFVAYTTAHPLLSRADLVTGFSTTTFNATTYPQFKAQREAVARALTDAGGTRTWNLLIDVIAQAGKFPPNSSKFAQFVVEGEKRYWLHVAIDRYTGEIVSQTLEPVYE